MKTVGLWVGVWALGFLVSAGLYAVLYQRAKHTQTPFPKKYGIGMVCGIPLLGVMLYAVLGAHQPLSLHFQQEAQAAFVATLPSEWKDPQFLIKQIKKTLQAHPKDGEGWFLLGGLYLQVGQYPAAVRSFEKACVLKPSSACEAQKAEANSLWGLAVYQDGQYAKAAKIWGAALQGLDPTHPSRPLLLEAIDRATLQAKTP